MLRDIRAKARETVAAYRSMVSNQYGAPPPEPTTALGEKSQARESASRGVEAALERSRQVHEAIQGLENEGA